MKIVYVYYGNHYLFDTWSKSINAVQHSFVPSLIFDFRRLAKGKGFSYKIFNFFRTRPILLQLLAFLESFFIPKADLYIIENMACMASVYFKKGKKLLFNGDQFFLNYEKSKGLRKWIMKKLMKKVDYAVSISELYRKIAQRHINVPNKLAYPYCNLEQYKRYRGNLNSKDICFLGYIVKLKGIDVLIKAFLELNKKYYNKLYLMGGMVDEIPVLNQYRNHKDIIVTGWIDKPQVYMQKCSTYMNMAYQEAFGINIVEAMAMGMVPIVSKNTGVAEIVAKIDKNLVVEANEKDVVKAFEWLHKDRGRLFRLSRVCRKEALKYTKENSVRMFRKAFEELVRKNIDKNQKLYI